MNREIVCPGGAGIYPVAGDVQSSAGSPQVKVTGIQGIKVQSGAVAGAVLTYNQNDNQWEALLRACVQVNGINASDDYFISVNATQMKVNGVSVA